MRKSTLVAVSAMTAAIIVVPTVATAANGGAWLLGRSNYESATTTVSNSAGTPLKLNAKSGYAPLAVNSTKTVTNLSADRLDSFDATSFAMRSGKTGTVVHDGSDDGLGVACPSGTVFASGGGYAKYGYSLYYSGPDWNGDTGAIIPNSWIVLDDAGYVGVSYVTCYSPSGKAVAGAATSLEQLVGTSYAAEAAGPMAMSSKNTAKLDQLKAAQSQSN